MGRFGVYKSRHFYLCIYALKKKSVLYLKYVMRSHDTRVSVIYVYKKSKALALPIFTKNENHNYWIALRGRPVWATLSESYVKFIEMVKFQVCRE